MSLEVLNGATSTSKPKAIGTRFITSEMVESVWARKSSKAVYRIVVI